MNKETILSLIEDGREIEFLYNGKKFSITYGNVDGVDVISFCEFYQESTEITNANELLSVKRYGKTVEEMLSDISEDSIWIF